MTRYLLDTSILIDYAKRREPALSRVNAMLANGDDLCTCAVVLAEYFAGVPPFARPVWEAFFAAFAYVDAPSDAAMQAGAYCWAFVRLGRPLALPGVLIAAAARSAGALVVTSNASDSASLDGSLV